MFAHIKLDKKALDRCEDMGSMVDPEMSFGYSMSGGFDFDELQRQGRLSIKKIKRKKKVKRKGAADPYEMSMDTRAYKENDMKLLPENVDISKSQNLDAIKK